jgi:hypothetical protein
MTTTSKLAPVVLFAYMRPDHLRLTVDSLRANPESAHTALTVHCDAPKRPEHQAGVDAVRAYVETIDGFASVRRVFRDRNLGLARSIVSGVTEALQAGDRVIVLEDDLLLSPHFLRFMNDGLECYRDDTRVGSIQGYWYPVERPLPETFFVAGADCWGWATWARAWAHFQPDGRLLLAELKQRRLTRAFDFDGTYPYTRMLRGQIAGRNDSWAVRWHASCFLRDLLMLYPGRSLVDNVGHDGSGTHCAAEATYTTAVAAAPVRVERIAVEASAAARAALVDFHRRTQDPLWRKVLLRARRELVRLRTRLSPQSVSR